MTLSKKKKFVMWIPGWKHSGHKRGSNKAWQTWSNRASHCRVMHQLKVWTVASKGSKEISCLLEKRRAHSTTGTRDMTNKMRQKLSMRGIAPIEWICPDAAIVTRCCNTNDRTAWCTIPDANIDLDKFESGCFWCENPAAVYQAQKRKVHPTMA